MRRAIAFALTLAIAGCAPARPDAARFRGAVTLSDAVERASSAYGVPRDVLLAVAYAEGRWVDPGTSPAGTTSAARGEAHAAPAVGPLHLRPGRTVDTLARARELLAVDDAELRADLGLQVAGAAAVLAQYGSETGASPDDVDSWAEAVARYSAIDGRAPQVEYAREVWEALRQGRRETVFTGETVHLTGRAGPSIETLLHVEQVAQFSTDYPPARWVPAASGNYGGARGRDPGYVAIHDTEGSYAGTISWFQNPMSNVATHYVIRSSDGEVTQMVRDTAIAYHVANSFYNTNAIGIEHEGFYTAPERWYTEAMYVASARLVRHLCDRYSIPTDREHIFGHYEVFRSGGMAICTGTWDSCRTRTMNHVDPGPGWNWSHYMDLVRGGGTVSPMYDAALVTVNYPREMQSGERAVAYVEYRNTGSAPWDATNTRLGTTQPRDHDGALYDSVNWMSRNRPTTVDRATAPSEVGRFSFVITAPAVRADTTVTESFGLLQEGVAWFGPADDAVTFAITVHPGTGPSPDAGMVGEDAAVAADVVSPGRDAGRSDGAGGSDAATTADGAMRADSGRPGAEAAGCGCRAARGSARTSAWGITMAAIALAARRKRKR